MNFGRDVEYTLRESHTQWIDQTPMRQMPYAHLYISLMRPFVSATVEIGH